MKNIITTLALSAMLSSASSAANFIKGQYYIGGAAIEGGWHDYGIGGALLLNGGKSIIKLGPGTIGAEAELSYTILSSDYDDDDYYDGSLKVLSLGLFATYKYDINKDLYVRPRFGPMFMSYSFNGHHYYTSSYYSRGNVALGIGMGYKLTKHMDLVSDFLVNSTSYRRISVGLQFKF